MADENDNSFRDEVEKITKDEYSKLLQKKLIFVSRDEWGAMPARENDLIRVNHPIRYIGVSFTTETPYCTDKESCIPIVQDIQRRHMNDKGLPDIAFNFLISLDGSVYEGRGWNNKPHKAATVKRMEDYAIDIAYIGDWCRRDIDPNLFESTLKTVQRGRKLRIIDRFFSWHHFDREVPAGPSPSPLQQFAL